MDGVSGQSLLPTDRARALKQQCQNKVKARQPVGIYALRPRCQVSRCFCSPFLSWFYAASLSWFRAGYGWWCLQWRLAAGLTATSTAISLPPASRRQRGHRAPDQMDAVPFRDAAVSRPTDFGRQHPYLIQCQARASLAE